MASAPIWKRLGYATQWQYRNAKARERINPDTGKAFRGARQERDQRARERGKPRNYEREREVANARSRRRGYVSASRERSVREALKKWGVSPAQFERYRSENWQHWVEVQDTKVPAFMHHYQEPFEKSAAKFVGYVISYFHSLVDPDHNWESKLDENGVWQSGAHRTSVGVVWTPDYDEWWRKYLVEYSEIYEADFFDTRYGLAP